MGHPISEPPPRWFHFAADALDWALGASKSRGSTGSLTSALGVFKLLHHTDVRANVR
jgi:hypothetical protein